MLKKIFTEKIEERIKANPNLSILDLGCGDASNFAWLIEKYPSMKYVGIEPGIRAAESAKERLARFNNAEIINSSAYNTAATYNNFDLCISLSVLEHVKDLERFLKNSIDSVKPGGELIHRYDLGHVLYSSSLKEKLQAILSKYFLVYLPESKVIRYIELDGLNKFLENNGVKVNRVSYHQMPSHKSFLKSFDINNEAREKLARAIVEWEFEVSMELAGMKQIEIERLFPSVCVWARKNDNV